MLRRTKVKGSIVIETDNNNYGIVGIKGIVAPDQGDPVRAVIDALTVYMDTIGSNVLEAYKASCKTWKHQPTFQKSDAVILGGDLKLRVALINDSKKGQKGLSPSQLYELIEAGSPAHTITAKESKGTRTVKTKFGGVSLNYSGVPLLVFKMPYGSRSYPNSLYSGPQVYGSTIRKAASVNHPGFKARNFSEIISEAYQKNVEKDVSDIIETTMKQFTLQKRVSKTFKKTFKNLFGLFNR